MAGPPSPGGPPGPPPLPSIKDFPPEYINANNSARIVGVVGFFHILALVIVALRVYVRTKLVRHAFGVDDVLVVVAAIIAFSAWICLFLQIPHGLGRHGLVIPIVSRTKMEQINFWKTVLSDGFGVGILRISVAISLLRLDRNTKWYRWSLYGVIVFVVLYSIQAIVWLFAYCKPYSGWWEFQWMNPFDERCHDFGVFLALTYWNVSCNIFTDVLLGALPVPIIMNLKMKLRTRLYLISVLNLGYLAVLMGILKAIFMFTTGGDPDQTFDLWVHFWQNLQLNIGIIAACASFLRPLVGRILKIDSTAAGYQSGSHRKTGDRPPHGPGNSFALEPRRSTRPEDDLGSDEFALHTKASMPAVSDSSLSRSRSNEDDVQQKGVYKYGVTVTSEWRRSEELIIQKQEAGRAGIVMSRDVHVQSSDTRILRCSST